MERKPQSASKARQERKTERAKAVAAEEGASLAAARMAGIGFVALLGGTGLLSGVMTGMDYMSATTWEPLDVTNVEQMKETLLGGQPWVVYCAPEGTRVDRAAIPAIFAEGSKAVKSGSRFGVVDCVTPLPSGKGIRQRYKFTNDPVLFAVANSDKPQQLYMLGSGEKLAAEISKVQKPRIWDAQNRQKLDYHCIKRDACLLMAHRTADEKKVVVDEYQPSLKVHRTLRFMSVDTNRWHLQLDTEFGTKAKDAFAETGRRVVCIKRQKRAAKEGKDGKMKEQQPDYFGRVFPVGGSPATFAAQCLSLEPTAANGFEELDEAPKITIRDTPKPKKVEKDEEEDDNDAPPAKPTIDDEDLDKLDLDD